MAIKKTKSFSPYSYGIRYRKIGGSPFRKYEYIPTGGQGEPVYVITKKKPEFFSSITNFWYFNIDDYGVISFLKVDSTIFIDKEVRTPYLKLSKVSESFKSLKFNISMENGSSYSWANEHTVNVFHNFELDVDSVVMINNEYVDEKCKKYYYNGSITIDFLNINLKQTDEIIVIVYPISSNQSFVNSEFFEEKIDKISLINDEINEKYLIENSYGAVNKKFIIKGENNEILNFSSIDVLPSYISIDKNELEPLSGINSITTYSSLGTLKTFNVQYGIDTNVITWDKNTVKINHEFGTDVNFIIDRNDARKMIKTIIKIDENNLEIAFNNPLYDPNVFSITFFRIGE